ncbi:conserved hypothetical protein [Mesorhizobium sp. SOD10]|nr:conserved hypothetical protein [Mesorhizobium sp. SOD10]
MNGKMREWFRNWRWALAASLFLHALIAPFLFLGLPRPDQQPDQQEQPVNVAIVPPPDQPKPKPVPRPPEPTPEKKAEKPPEQPVQKPPPPQPPKPQDIPVLKRVFQYGEKDTGPQKSPDGGSAPANAPSPAKDQPAKPSEASQPAPNQSAPPATPEQQADTNRAKEKPVTAAPEEKTAQSEETDTQHPETQEAAPQTAAKQAAEAPKPLGAEAGDKPAPAEKAKPKASKATKFKSARALRAPSGSPARSNPAGSEVAGSPIYSGLPGVRKLYSPGATGNALATSSMEKVPRDQRVANLCANVLNQELQSADYSPKWLPTIPLKQGNVLNPTQTAFSTTTQWYDLSFRCEVDADATRVLSFNFRVGGLVPPGEWTRRRFPSLR